MSAPHHVMLFKWGELSSVSLCGDCSFGNAEHSLSVHKGHSCSIAHRAKQSHFQGEGADNAQRGLVVMRKNGVDIAKSVEVATSIVGSQRDGRPEVVGPDLVLGGVTGPRRWLSGQDRPWYNNACCSGTSCSPFNIYMISDLSFMMLLVRRFEEDLE